MYRSRAVRNAVYASRSRLVPERSLCHHFSPRTLHEDAPTDEPTDEPTDVGVPVDRYRVPTCATRWVPGTKRPIPTYKTLTTPALRSADTDDSVTVRLSTLMLVTGSTLVEELPRPLNTSPNVAARPEPISEDIFKPDEGRGQCALDDEEHTALEEKDTEVDAEPRPEFQTTTDLT